VCQRSRRLKSAISGPASTSSRAGTATHRALEVALPIRCEIGRAGDRPDQAAPLGLLQERRLEARPARPGGLGSYGRHGISVPNRCQRDSTTVWCGSDRPFPGFVRYRKLGAWRPARGGASMRRRQNRSGSAPT
jgi:hypothetical protein